MNIYRGNDAAEQLGRELQAKFPQYKGRDAAELGRKYQAKRPDLVKFVLEETAPSQKEMEYTDIDPGELLSNLPGDIAQVTGETVEGLYDIAGQALTTPISEGVIASLARLGAGGVDVLAEKAGIEGVDIGSPQSEAAARQMGTQFAESFDPENLEKRPAQAVSNALSIIPTRGILTGLGQAAKAGKMPRAASALSKVRKGVDAIDPTTMAYTGAKSVVGGAARKGQDFIDSVRQRGDKKLKEEYAEAALGFSTSTGEAAVRELRDLSNTRGEQWINRFRSWRGMPREEAFAKAFDEFSDAVRQVKEKAQQSYSIAEDRLGPVLRRPLEEVKPGSVEEMQGALIGVIEEYGGSYNVLPSSYKRELVGLQETKSPIFSRGRDLPPAQQPVYGEVVDKPSRFEVSFEGAEVIPGATNLKGILAKEFEDFLNLDPTEVTGMEIHKLRKNLDKTINNMPGGGDPSDIYKGPFRVRTELREALSNALETTYGEQYRTAMADYRKVAELQRDMYNTFKITGSSVDKARREAVLAELANTYNPNARQALRPDLLREFEELSGNENILAMTLGTLFQPFVSKGLAQRSELANIISMTGTALTGAMTGDPITTAVVFGLSQLPQQVLYNPRMASEMIVRLSKGKKPGYRSKVAGAVDAMAKTYDKLPPTAQRFIKSLPPNTPMKVALERLANETGFDITDVSAEEGTQENQRLLKSLSRAGTTPPSR